MAIHEHDAEMSEEGCTRRNFMHDPAHRQRLPDRHGGAESLPLWTIAATLGLPLATVRVIGHYVGGGFGSKLQPGKYTAICALLAKKAAKPVKLLLTREETYLGVGNRPANSMRLKAGVTRDGRLTALDFDCSGPSGAYLAGGAQLVDWRAGSLPLRQRPD